MKKNLLFLLIILIITASIKINYAFNSSLIEQTILVSEFNNSGSLDYPFDKVQDFNHTFPNVTVTGLPISFMKARYYLKAKKFDEALALIYESMKINPYIGVLRVCFLDIYICLSRVCDLTLYQDCCMNLFQVLG